MNYYNPYFLNIPSGKVGLFSRLFGNLKFSSILSGTNKALNFVNQTIPVIKQIKPMVKNAKTMFNVFNEFRKVDENKSNIKEIKKEVKTSNQPTFFIN